MPHDDLKDKARLLTEEELKSVYKDAMKEFLYEQKSKVQENVGRWAINIFFASLVTALAYFTLIANGWQKK